jgi:hypothetical protein
MLAPVSATGRAMQIGMTSQTRSLIDMSMTPTDDPGPAAPGAGVNVAI